MFDDGERKEKRSESSYWRLVESKERKEEGTRLR